MRLGMICRYDNSGVGTLSWEFARHLKPHKILLVENHVYQTFPERYAEFDTKKFDAPIDHSTLDWFLKDIDVLFTIETPYYWPIITECRKRGIKTVLYTMYEMTPDPIPLHFDLYLCPSKLDYDVMPSPKVYLPVPLAIDRLLWKKREQAVNFIHSASHGGVNGRKGTKLLLDAIPLVKNPNVRFTIYSWKPFTTDDKRVTIEVVNFKNYWQMWREGDVLVYPQDYNGICLPIVEAMASGMGVITTDIYPFNEYMPKELLFAPDSMYRTRASARCMETDAARISPQAIATKIDEYALQDISSFSEYGRRYALEHSWDVLLPKYLDVFNNLLLPTVQEHTVS